MQNLHSHKDYSNVFASFKDSHVSYEAYAKRAVELGQKVVTSVEHGYQGNYLRCWEICEQYGLKFVFGVEAYWVRDRHEPDNTNAHILILARNESGRRQINKMLAEANKTGFYVKPRVDMELLRTLHPADVLVTTACVAFWGKPTDENSVAWHYEGMDTVDGLFMEMYEHFGSSLYLEVQAHNTPWQKIINKHVLDIHYMTNIPLIVGLDSHYIYPEQRKERQILREEAGGKKLDEDFEFDDNVYEDYPDEQTVIARFRAQGVLNESEIAEAIANTDVALEFDDLVFGRERKLPKNYRGMDREQCAKEYERRIREAFAKYSENLPKEEAERRWNDMWAQECGPVIEEGQAVYFLLNSDLVDLGQKMGGTYTNSGRGSAGSFFSNKLMGLTGLDRFELPVTLYPGRFMTPERLRTSLPDVDMNCDDQKIFADAQEQLMGKGHVAPMIAYGTQKPKSAFRMYARAKNVPMEEQIAVTKQIEQYERALQNADDEEEKESIFIEDYVDAQYMQYVAESEPYRGIVVTKSQAPCGFLLYDGDIESEIGVIRIAAKTKKDVVYCTVIDGATADAFGYVKNDVLVVMVCAINAAASSKAGIPYLSAEEVIERTKNDPATWNIFAKGLTMGINQCQGAKTIEKLMQYKPRSLQDMSAFVAAIRPGFKSMVNKFLAREKFSYGVPAFDDQLHNDSSGSSWLLYQEDVMKCLAAAGFPLEETYPIIKAISKKKVKVIEAAHERFLTGFTEYQKAQGEKSESKAKENAEMVWQVLYNSSSYSFNCVPGRTKIMTAASDGFGISVEQLWHDYLRATWDGPKLGYMFVSMDENGNVVKNTAVSVDYVGARSTYRLILDDGSEISATAEHKFPTINGEKRLCDLTSSDWLYVYRPGNPTKTVDIVRVNKIMYCCVEDVYNVTMNDPYHNFISDTGIVTSNCSHSVAVALDAIYGAYLKAHYPLQYYTTLLDAYTAKGDKDRVALIKEEMRKGFGITIAPCHFRQDNRYFSFDTDQNTVSDALPSIRNLSMAVAEELAKMKDNRYASFVDVLLDMTSRHPFNATNIEVLIKMDYFREFGRNGKLMEVWTQFRSGDMQYKKTYVDATRAKRLAALKEFERNCPDEPLSPYDQMSFEAVHYGAPISVFPECKQTYVVMAVETKYSPKLSLYSMATGKSGQVKVKKSTYAQDEAEPGDIICVGDYEKRPKYTYIDGKPTPIPGTSELWVKDYVVVMRHDELTTVKGA